MEESIDAFLRRVAVEPPPGTPNRFPSSTAASQKPSTPVVTHAAPMAYSGNSWNTPQSDANPDMTLIPSSAPLSSANDATLIAGTGSARTVVVTLVSNDPMFPTLTKELTKPVKVGRHMGPESDADPFMICYETKVVSRIHAEIWAVGNDVFIKDLSSKSGTFLNGNRLSAASKESQPFKLNAGDAIQFGVDFQDRNIKEQRAVVVIVQFSAGKPVISNPSIAALQQGSSLNRKNSLTSLEDLRPGVGAPPRPQLYGSAAVGAPPRPSLPSQGSSPNLANLTMLGGAIRR